MKLFRRKKRENRAKVVVYDVRLASPQRRVIKLREKIWTFTFAVKIGRFWKFITRHRLAFGTLLLFLLIGGGFLNNYLATRAQLAIYYPNSALGSWKHPENAQGEPQLDKKSKPEKFTEENSALLDKKESELYLGNFQGEIPEGSLPQGFFLSFIWNVSSRNTDKDILAVSYTLDNSDWKELGKVSPQGKPSTFELPLTKWDDLSKVQISIKSTADFGDGTKVYLDGVTLGVEYEEISGQESLSQEEIDKLPKKEMPADQIFGSSKKDFQAGERPEFEIRVPDPEEVDAAAGKTIDNSPMPVNTEKTSQEEESSPEPLPTEEEETLPPPEEPVPVDPDASGINPEAPVQGDTQDDGGNMPTDQVEPASGLNDQTSSLEENQGLSVITKVPFAFTGELKNWLSIDKAEANASDLVKTVVTNPDGKEIDLVPEITDTDEGMKISLPESGNSFRPGKYALTVQILSGSTIVTSTQDFSWGILAMNTNKSIYSPGEKSNIAMAVLDEAGNMVCDAKVVLRIRNQKFNVSDELSTENGKITTNPECQQKSFTLTPDYEAHYNFDKEGTYELNLEAATGNGTYSITDKVGVKKDIPFDVERVTATRIYPPSDYPVTFNIIANRNFQGAIQERVPDSFNVDKGEGDYQKYDKEEADGKAKIISWNVDIKKGDKITLGYKFKAPQISPQFYLLGPLKFTEESSLPFVGDGIAFEEARQWQIAADDVTGVKLRQEINIIDSTYSTAVDSSERVYITPAQYSGSLTYKFEIVAKGTGTVTLHDSSNNVHATISVTEANYAKSTVTCSSAPTLDTYHINLSEGTGLTVQAARVIVLQDSGSTEITSTETQIEVGDYDISNVNTSAVALDYPKYWNYTAANWDGTTKNFYAEVVWKKTDTETQQQIDTFTTSSSWQAPAGTSSVLVEAWGGGGGGGAGTNKPGAGSGAAGGSFASDTVNVTPLQTYNYTVGAAQTTDSTTGNPTYFDAGANVYAQGGAGGAANGGTAGQGSTASCVGATKIAGGNGDIGRTSGSPLGGGYGGAGANSGGAGGATQGTAGQVGNNGTNPGGGAGGGYTILAADKAGGDGARGQIKLTYTMPVTTPTVTVILQVDDGNFSGWTTAATIVNALNTSGTITRTRSSSFTPSDGKNYRIVASISNGTQHSYDIYNAKIVVDQAAGNISNAAYATKYKLVSGQDLTPDAMAFNSDGYKMYVVGDTNNGIYQYALSTAWDVSSAVFETGKSFITTTQTSIPVSVAFNTDGDRMYVAGYNNATVFQYTLTTAWDVSTANYTTPKSKVVSAQDATPNGAFFSTDGTKMYMIGDTNNTIYQYTLTIAWDVSTANYDTPKYKLVSAEDASPYSIYIDSDGTKMYMYGFTNKRVYQYTLTTAWDVSTASYDSKNFLATGQDATPNALAFSSDSSIMYLVGNTSDTIYQYTTNIAPLTLLETQYLLQNTYKNATGLQDFDTAWTTTEWAGVTNTYYHEINSSSDTADEAKLQYYNSGSWTDVTGSSATGTAYRKRTGSLTMPATDTLDTNIVNVPIYASRIIVKVNINGGPVEFFVSGTSNIGTGTIVRAAVGGSLASQTATVQGDTTWSISGITQPSSDTIIVVFATDADGDIDNTSESTAVGKYSGTGSMTSMVLDINVLSIGGVGSQSIAASDLAGYDCANDEDVMYNAGHAVSNTLQVEGTSCAGSVNNSYSAEKIDVLTTDTLTVSGSETLTTYDLTITGTLTSGGASTYNVTHNWTNNGTFTASSSTVNLNGTTEQNLSGTGTMTGSSAFYNLTITNNSGASASDNERTGFTPSVDFDAAATATNNFTIATANVRVEYESAATYTFNNINWAGTASNLIYFRNSATSGTWLLKVTGVQTAVSYVNVSRSDASVSGGSAIQAYDGTNYDAGPTTNVNWLFTSNARLRQEINILNSTYSSAGDSSEMVYINPAKYSGSVKYKFEIDAKVTSGTGTVVLHDSSNNVHATISVTAANYAKSTEIFSTVPTADTYHINLSGGTGLTVQAARVIILQDSGSSSITNTETQVEIGDFDTSNTNTTTAPLDYPKYWLYTAASSDGSKTFYAEASYVSSSASGNVTIILQKDAAGDLATWSPVVTIVDAQHPTTATLSSRVTFTPADGCNYRIAAYISSGSYNYSIYNAKVVVDQVGGSGGSDISTATNPGSKRKVVGTDTSDTAIYGVFLKPDGTKMYVLGGTNDRVYQYSLSTAGDVLTATYESVYQSLTSQSTTMEGIFFSSDGYKLYALDDSTTDYVYQYTLGTAWDLSGTLTYNQSYTLTGTLGSHGIYFKPDGTEMYVAESTGDDVRQYHLTSGWDISTASYTTFIDVSTRDGGCRGVFLSSDGYKMYFAGNTNTNIYQYNLSSAWDISTALYSSTFLVSDQDTGPYGLFFDSTGNKMYMAGNLDDAIYQYYLSTAWSLSTASYRLNYKLVSEDASQHGLFFNPDGTKMYVSGSTGDSVYQYTLSTAWNVSTASYSTSRSLSAQTAGIEEIFFSSDGYKMYLVGDDATDVNDGVYRYSLGTAWDISGTFSNDQYFDQAQTQPRGIFFNSDGTKMYLTMTNNDSIYQYSLSPGWDLSTASYVSSLSIATVDTGPRGIFFNSVGTKMYFVGDLNDKIYSYSLSPAWDISSASYDGASAALWVGAQDVVPYGLFIKSDWTEIYVVGNTGEVVYQFSNIGPITLVETQYLLANTNQSTTGLKDFDTAWDPGDWYGVTNNYYHEINTSSSSGDSAKLQYDPNGSPTDVGSSTVAGAYRARSSVMSMPGAAQTLDVNVVDAPIYASRIIVKMTVAGNITVSGTSDLSSGTVAVAINNTMQSYKVGSISSGTWSISAVTKPSTNAIITAWVDGAAAGDESTGIGKYSGSSNMTDMVLNQNVLSIGGVGNQSVAVSDLTAAATNYDNGDDEDVMHTASSSTLTVDGGGSYSTEKIDILSSDSLSLATSETLATHHIDIHGTLTSSGNSIYNVAGNWTNTGTFTASTSTVNLTGNSSAHQTITTNAQAFKNLTLNNTQGTNDQIIISNTLDLNGDITITDGQLNLATYDPNVTLAGDVSIASAGSWTKQDNGSSTTTFDGDSGPHTFTDSSSGGPQDLGLVIVNNGATGNDVNTASNMKVTTLNIYPNNTLDIASDNLTIAGTGTPFTRSGAGTFASRVDKTTAEYPRSVAIGDLNNDGWADMVSANYTPDSISVFLNNGDGTFADKADYTTANQPISVAIGDVNNDGWDDIAVANDLPTTGYVSVFLNDGDGTFDTARADYACDDASQSIAISDLNNDGWTDIATANWNATVSVLLNDGDGTFGTNTDYSTGVTDSTRSVAVGDVNNDGYPDLAAANYANDSVSVFRNDEDGTFDGISRADYTTANQPISVAIGDLDNNGWADIATADDNTPGYVSVFLDNADGTFAAKADYPVENAPQSITVGDFNGDGWDDLATVNWGATASVVMNDGDGTFADDSIYSTDAEPLCVAAGDLNNDGWDDLAVADSNTWEVSTLLNEGGDLVTTGSTVTYTGTTTATNITSNTYHNLTLAPTSAATYSLKGDQTGTRGLSGTMNIGSNATLDAVSGANYDIDVAGSWTKTGGFTARSATVTFDGADSTTQTLSGGSTFYNFRTTIPSSLGRSLAFTDGTTQTVSGKWTIMGASGKVIILTRTGTSSNWTISPTAALVTYALVDHSDSTLAICATYSTSGGSNNANWSFSTGSSCGGSLGLSCSGSAVMTDYMLGSQTYNESTLSSTCSVTTPGSTIWSLTIQSTNLTSTHNTVTNSNVLLHTDGTPASGFTTTDRTAGISESNGSLPLNSIQTIIQDTTGTSTGTYINSPTIKLDQIDKLYYNESTTGTITITLS